MSMDKKPKLPKRIKSKQNNNGLKNLGFFALLILFGLVIYASTHQPTNIKEISSSTAIKDNNAGDYSKIVVNGNQLDITKKGEDKATLKTYVDSNSSLKEQGFDTSKTAITYKSENNSSSNWVSFGLGYYTGCSNRCSFVFHDAKRTRTG
jgi:ATP-dependent Zn protease